MKCPDGHVPEGWRSCKPRRRPVSKHGAILNNTFAWIFRRFDLDKIEGTGDKGRRELMVYRVDRETEEIEMAAAA